MLKKIKNHIAIISSFAILATSNAAAAATAIKDPQDIGDLSTIITKVSGAIIGIAAFISVIYIIIGGFNYITSSGNQEKVTTAKNTLIYAILGLVIVILAYSLQSYAISAIFTKTISPSI